MDLSLDEIIQSKKKAGVGPSKKFNSKKGPTARKTVNRTQFKETRHVKDARLKIIAKNREKILDARDKLAEITRANGDARQKILAKQEANAAIRNDKNNSYSNGNGNTQRSRRRVFRIDPNVGLKSKSSREQQQQKRYQSPGNGMRKQSSRLPDVVEAPRGYVDYDNMERMEKEEYAVAAGLSRTVKNDITPYDNYGPHHENMSYENMMSRRHISWGSAKERFDPFDVYEVPMNRHERRVSLELPLPPPPPPAPTSDITRPSMHQHTSSDLYQRRYIPESTTHLSYEMRSRLERAPDPHASMGIFANQQKVNMRLPNSSDMETSSTGYRIVVSNLHTNVSQFDIKELFGDIGELFESRIVRPGIAEVIYKTLNDAKKAVDIYHNRQLDGQPMKCMLVNPRASNKPTAPAMNTSNSNSRHNPAKTPLEIDIDALHKVLFRRH